MQPEGGDFGGKDSCVFSKQKKALQRTNRSAILSPERYRHPCRKPFEETQQPHRPRPSGHFPITPICMLKKLRDIPHAICPYLLNISRTRLRTDRRGNRTTAFFNRSRNRQPDTSAIFVHSLSSDHDLPVGGSMFLSSALITIHLENLRHNVRTLLGRHPLLMPVIKADAYGMGSSQ